MNKYVPWRKETGEEGGGGEERERERDRDTYKHLRTLMWRMNAAARSLIINKLIAASVGHASHA